MTRGCAMPAHSAAKSKAPIDRCGRRGFLPVPRRHDVVYAREGHAGAQRDAKTRSFYRTELFEVSRRSSTIVCFAVLASVLSSKKMRCELPLCRLFSATTLSPTVTRL